ncbi:epoxide hydrolase, partial [Stagonosporopsis vannaccii]
ALAAQPRSDLCQFNLKPNTDDIAKTSYVGLVKSVKIPSGRTYRYVFSPPFDPEKPYLLFLHGFPDSSYGWVNQIDYFTRQGYGIIAPDMLGYGGTDKPADLESYRLKTIASELVDLLDCEGVSQVVAIGHDFGTAALSILQAYSPDRLAGLAYLTLGYTPPGGDLPLAAIEGINNQTNAVFGYPVFGYFIYHITEEAAAGYDSHLDSAYSLWFTNNATYQKEHLAPLGQLERWLSEDRQAPYGSAYVSNVTKEQWKTIVKAQGGLDGGLKWYKALLSGLNQADALALQSKSPIITKPTLLVTSNFDPICLPILALNNTVPYAPFARTRTLNAGHFVQVEAADEFNYELHEWLKTMA